MFVAEALSQKDLVSVSALVYVGAALNFSHPQTWMFQYQGTDVSPLEAVWLQCQRGNLCTGSLSARKDCNFKIPLVLNIFYSAKHLPTCGFLM